MRERGINSIVNLSLFCYIFTIQFFQFNIISRISIVLFVGLQALYILIKKEFVVNYFAVGNLLFIVYNLGLIFLGYSINNTQSIAMVVTLIISLIINIMIISRLSDEQNWNYFIKGFITVSLLLAIYIITTNFNALLHARSVGVYDPFGLGVAYNANILGLSFSMAGVFSVYKYIESKKTIYLVLVPILLFLVLLTGSRKSLILFFVCFLIAMLLIYQDKRFRIILITVASITLIYGLIINIPFLYNIVGIRVEAIIQGVINDEFTEASARTRDNLIGFGLELFKLQPYTGYGLDTFRLMSWSGLYAHNNYLELLVSSGIYGTIIYYTIYIWIIVKLYILQKADLISKFLFAIMIYFIIGDYIIVSYSSHLLTMILAVCAARIQLYDPKKQYHKK